MENILRLSFAIQTQTNNFKILTVLLQLRQRLDNYMVKLIGNDLRTFRNIIFRSNKLSKVVNYINPYNNDETLDFSSQKFTKARKSCKGNIDVFDLKRFNLPNYKIP